MQLLYTPLHYAAEYGHADVAALLIEHGADLEAQEEVRAAAAHAWRRTSTRAPLPLPASPLTRATPCPTPQATAKQKRVCPYRPRRRTGGASL